MTVKELIERLQAMPQGLPVKCYSETVYTQDEIYGCYELYLEESDAAPVCDVKFNGSFVSIVGV